MTTDETPKINDGLKKILKTSAEEVGIFDPNTMDFDVEVAKYQAFMAVAARNNDFAGHLMYLGILIWISIANGKDEKFLEQFFEASPLVKENAQNGVGGTWDVIGAFLDADRDLELGQEYARIRLIRSYKIAEAIAGLIIARIVKDEIIGSMAGMDVFQSFLGKGDDAPKPIDEDELKEGMRSFWLEHCRPYHSDHDPEHCSAEAVVLSSETDAQSLLALVTNDLLLQIQLGEVNNHLWSDYVKVLYKHGLDVPISVVEDYDPEEMLNKDSQDFLSGLMEDFD